MYLPGKGQAALHKGCKIAQLPGNATGCPQLCAHGVQEWQEQVAATCISRLHRDVSEALAAMGVQHENEGVTEDRLFSVDIMLRSARVAVEVDGPFHFTANTRRPLGMPPPIAHQSCPGNSARAWHAVHGGLHPA